MCYCGRTNLNLLALFLSSLRRRRIIWRPSTYHLLNSTETDKQPESRKQAAKLRTRPRLHRKLQAAAAAATCGCAQKTRKIVAISGGRVQKLNCHVRAKKSRLDAIQCGNLCVRAYCATRCGQSRPVAAKEKPVNWD